MIKAILTGHSKGLGLGIARSLLCKGHPVLGLSRSINDELQHEFPPLLQQVAIDLSEISALEHWANGTQLQEFIENATLLLLINNAGLVTPIGPLHAQDPVEIARSVQLNVTAPMVLSAKVTHILKNGQELRVLHVSSGAGRRPYPGWSVYGATKAALDIHAQTVKLDGQPNVRICSLAPGVIDTGMQAQIRETDVNLFPNKQRFIELNNEGALTNPQHTGEHLVNYLLAPGFGQLAVDDLRSN
ncbi:MAG: SDR family oxidoreductase [Gammaproteobacteria bacterium]|nr:SDR family oxidoreductase [Gammaproteobacteria bacterium]MBU0850122.1 SDR family oxidoreductase [Gammaproteobacteria bacterium]MBU1268610.1 SDR family oxidoreductase [Gammaproteobacteria bacterium]MBU1530034.1 SDR family oxidoreductase [Gammaproteobacteria bacterium]MBU1780907.1 SDR family oxidoreductase [Gammaproteobacteria bacterium]